MVGKQADVYDEALPGYEGSVYQDPGIIDTIGDGGGTMDGDLGFGSLCRYFKAKLRETEDNYSASNVRTYLTWRPDIDFSLSRYPRSWSTAGRATGLSLLSWRRCSSSTWRTTTTTPSCWPGSLRAPSETRGLVHILLSYAHYSFVYIERPVSMDLWIFM